MTQDPPPIPKFPPPLTLDQLSQWSGPAPLTPPQQELNDARLSTVVFSKEDLEKIQKSIITAFDTSLRNNKTLHKNKDTKIAEEVYHDYNDPINGLNYVTNTIEKILLDKKPPIRLNKEQKEGIKNNSKEIYVECRENYKDTMLIGVGKDNTEKVKTAMAIAARAVGSMVTSVLGSLGLNKAKKIAEDIRKKRNALGDNVKNVTNAVRNISINKSSNERVK